MKNSKGKGYKCRVGAKIKGILKVDVLKSKNEDKNTVISGINDFFKPVAKRISKFKEEIVFILLLLSPEIEPLCLSIRPFIRSYSLCRCFVLYRSLIALSYIVTSYGPII